MGRSFAIETVRSWGWPKMRVAVARELVDVMYTPADSPYVSHADGLASVGTAIGSIDLAVDESMNVGDAVTFVVSADRMSVTPQQTQQSNSVLCQLISEEFVGSVITLHLETPDGTELKAQIQQRNLDDLTPEPGANLWVSWSAQHAHILPG